MNNTTGYLDTSDFTYEQVQRIAKWHNASLEQQRREFLAAILEKKVTNVQTVDDKFIDAVPVSALEELLG